MNAAFCLLLLLELAFATLLTPCTSIFAVILLPSMRSQRHTASIFVVLTGRTTDASNGDGIMVVTEVDTVTKKTQMRGDKYDQY